MMEFRHVQNSLCVQALRSPILAVLLHGTPAAGSAKLRGMVQGMELLNFRRRRHLFLAGRPSRWVSAHILVLSSFFPLSKLSRRRLDVCHTSTHDVVLVRIQNACLKWAARGSL